MNRSSRQKINKETLDLNYTLDQMYLKDRYRTVHPQYTPLKHTWNTFLDKSHVRSQNESY